MTLARTSSSMVRAYRNTIGLCNSPLLSFHFSVFLINLPIFLDTVKLRPALPEASS